MIDQTKHKSWNYVTVHLAKNWTFEVLHRAKIQKSHFLLQDEAKQPQAQIAPVTLVPYFFMRV